MSHLSWEFWVFCLAFLSVTHYGVGLICYLVGFSRGNENGYRMGRDEKP